MTTKTKKDKEIPTTGKKTLKGESVDTAVKGDEKEMPSADKKESDELPADANAAKDEDKEEIPRLAQLLMRRHEVDCIWRSSAVGWWFITEQYAKEYEQKSGEKLEKYLRETKEEE